MTRSELSAPPSVRGLNTLTSNFWRRDALLLLGIAVVTCVAYWPALGGGILWDDAAHIPRAELRSLDGLRRMWTDVRATQQYYPLLFSWFWLQYQLWGEQMLGYHVVNVTLHLGAALLVYLVLKKLRIPGAILAAAIFALHPVHVESVAWVTEQKNTLSAVFYLGAMWSYLHFDGNRRRSWYYLALGLFVAALLSKTVTVTLPPALLVILWWSRSRDPEALEGRRGSLTWKRDVQPLVPFFLLAIADGLLTVWVERKVIGAEGADFELSLAQRALLCGRASWFYLEKLLWPVDLIFIYPRWRLDPAQLGAWLFVVGLLLVLVGAWAMRRWSRAPLAALLFFVGTLLPVLGFLNVFFFRYSFVADHFQYLASLGVIVLLSGAVAWGLARLAPPVRAAGIAGCVVMLGALAALTWRQSHLYGRDVVYFYETTLAQNPDSFMTRYNLGLVHLNAGELQEAVADFDETLRLKPEFSGARTNLGLAFTRMQRRDEAKACFEAVLAEQPDDAAAHHNLGNLLLEDEQYEAAARHLARAVELRVGNLSEAEANLSSALLHLERGPEAIPHCYRAIALDPDALQNRLNLIVAFNQADQFPKTFEATLEALAVARAQNNQAVVERLEGWLERHRPR